MTDYTAEMGATRVVPGSQVGDKKPTDYADDECLQAEMSRGSVLIYSGKIVHSGAANRSDQARRAINVNYCVGWVRQEENQFLSVPPEVAWVTSATSRIRCARSAATRSPTASTRPNSTAVRVRHSPTNAPIASETVAEWPVDARNSCSGVP